MIATQLTLVGNFANLTNFRNQASAGFTANSRATCILSAGNRPIYRWNSALTTADNGVSVVKPNDIGGASPGRWVISDWVETSSDSISSQAVFSIDLGTSASASVYDFQLGAGWRLLTLTIEGTNRIAWFVKDVSDT